MTNMTIEYTTHEGGNWKELNVHSVRLYKNICYDAVNGLRSAVKKRSRFLPYARVLGIVYRYKKPHIFKHNGCWFHIPVSSAFVEFRWRKVENKEIAWMDAHASNFCRSHNKGLRS